MTLSIIIELQINTMGIFQYHSDILIFHVKLWAYYPQKTMLICIMQCIFKEFNKIEGNIQVLRTLNYMYPLEGLQVPGILHRVLHRLDSSIFFLRLQREVVARPPPSSPRTPSGRCASTRGPASPEPFVLRLENSKLDGLKEKNKRTPMLL